MLALKLQQKYPKRFFVKLIVCIMRARDPASNHRVRTIHFSTI